MCGEPDHQHPVADWVVVTTLSVSAVVTFASVLVTFLWST